MYKIIAALISVQILAACGGDSRTNRAPQISALPDTTIQANQESASIPIAVSDRRVNLLTLTSSSDNQAVVPDSGLSLAGSNGNFTLNITPAPATLGTATITITASDAAGLTTQTSFSVDVMPQQVVLQNFVRQAIAMPRTGMPLDINSRQFEDDVASDDFADLLN